MKIRGWIWGVLLIVLPLLAPAWADDGYQLWLSYPRLSTQLINRYTNNLNGAVYRDEISKSEKNALSELDRGLSGMLGVAVQPAASVDKDGVLVIGTGKSAEIKKLGLPLKGLGPDGYLMRSMKADGHKVTVIAAKGDAGLIHGVFALLSRMQRGEEIAALDVRAVPKVRYRVLDHWDNLDRRVERGYAGQSLWDWFTLPDYLAPRYSDYARADASLGINGVVLNNVNAAPEILTPRYLDKVAALYHVFWNWGVQVYLSVNFAAPMKLGGLPTADPKDPRVQAWWRAKADAIYRRMPFFGGFLVKANSEGQPGPQDYGRTQAEGANMLADALAPHDGIVMWRAFVYQNDPRVDRVAQAYNAFKPLDGKFRNNVIVQVKNGPLDFQPREPFHPLFGALAHTNTGIELQVTKEYLGFNTHLVYLGPLFHEAFAADTFRHGPGSTVARVVEGRGFGDGRHTLVAGVANVGSDRNWTGSIFNQANWYVFGRMAWDPAADPAKIARDWVQQTFRTSGTDTDRIVKMMMMSREAAVDYMTPLGLAHQMGTGHHYGPAPWVHNLARADWNPVYYNRADRAGIGVDRTKRGSHALAQYAPGARKAFADLSNEKYLLWFHHLPWNYPVAGTSLWAELIRHYDRGVAAVGKMQALWAKELGAIDEDRFDQTAAFLKIQAREAKWWRDASIAYFQSVNGLPLPAGVTAPAHSLKYYESLKFPYAPGQAH